MRYNPKAIEKKWQQKWSKEKIYEPDFKSAKKPFYNLMMFPYPSAEGLHIGAVRTFSGVDIYGRFKRMQGFDVFEPIGLDGFGIHSENFALKIRKHPKQHAKDSEKNFYRQLASIGNGFAWGERLETYDPEYYKWTQWIFVQMFKRGLAYRKKAEVSWCPSCMTVLADEQVIQKSQILNPKSQTNSNSKIINLESELKIGVCERCDTPVIKKELEQWFFKITDYAERLLNNLDKLDWTESVKIAQRNWIGRSEGVLIRFSLSNPLSKSDFDNFLLKSDFDSYIEIFTTRPDTLFGATYLVLGPEHPLITNHKLQITNYKEVEKYIKSAKLKTSEERIAEGKEKTGVELKEVKAINPANQEEIPVWVADYVLGNVGTGAIMAVPAHDQRDFEFAKKFNLPIKMVVCPHYPAKTCPVLDKAYVGEGHLVDSGKFNGMPSEKAKEEIAKFGGGKKQVNYRLRDWLISRQRYWGPPIPMIFCDKCGWQPVPEKDLPVLLPDIKNFRPTGTDRGPLAAIEKFYKVKCPKCKSPARRETDVSDAFLDSSWYFLRYPSVRESKKPWNPETTKTWFPVNMYIGGAEHSVLHLLYSRFITMAFHDMGLLDFSAKGGSASGGEEPFKVFRAHGLITKNGFKMSKSRGNVVNPDEYINAYGIDAIRMYLAFLAPLSQGGDFRDEGIKGVTRFLERVYKLISNIQITNSKQVINSKNQIQNIVHKTIKKVTEDIENLQYNTAISALMILLNKFEENQDSVRGEDVKIFLKLLAPFAPFSAEELWQNKFSDKKFRSIHFEKWPEYDEKLIREDTFELIIQINGKMRDKLEAKIGISQKEAEMLTIAREKIKLKLGDKKPKKVIYVPDRLINIVL